MAANCGSFPKVSDTELKALIKRFYELVPLKLTKKLRAEMGMA